MACQAGLKQHSYRVKMHVAVFQAILEKKQGKFQIWLALLLKNSRTAKCY
jgi:hypothetical protein